MHIGNTLIHLLLSMRKKNLSLLFVLLLLMISGSQIYASKRIVSNSTEHVINCEGEIETNFLKDYSEYIRIGVSYLPLIKVSIVQKQNGLLDVTLHNVVYANSQLQPSNRGIGNISFEVTIDADGNIQGSEPIYSEGNLEAYDSWDGILYEYLYVGEIVGKYKDDKFEATISLWVENPLMGIGEFVHTITLTNRISTDYSYSRSVVAGNYGTIVLPFKPERVSGISHLYSLKGKKLDDNGNIECFVLREEKGIEAGVPYIFLSDATEITAWAPIDVDWVVLPKNTYYVAGFGNRPANNGLQGTFETKNTYDIGEVCEYYDDWGDFSYEEYVPYKVYLLSNNRVVRAGQRSTISTNRAYILSDYVPTISNIAEAKGICLGLDEATGVNVVERTLDGRCDIFDLTGRKIPQLQKGINIMNGRMIVK